MLTFQQYITEIFDSPYDYTGEWINRNHWKGFFTTKDNIRYRVTIFNYRSWEIIFSRDEDNEVGITNTGDSVRIFSTVAKIVEEFIKERQPEKIQFSSKTKEPTRIKLYNMLAKKLADKYGYDVKNETEYDEYWYYLTKK
jgi:hypothetical protein